MNAEFFEALEAIEKEKGISRDYMLSKISQALVSAYKRDNLGEADNIFVNADPEKKEIRMYLAKEVVEEVENPALQISVDAAQSYKAGAMVGDIIDIDIETKKFGRIAAQTAKQVIIQGIREAERGMVYDQYTSKEHEVLTGTVLRADPRTGNLILNVGTGGEKSEALLARNEQSPIEQLGEGDMVKVYVLEVRRSNHGPQILVSRTHPGLVKRLFELEVPEIFDGIVEIKSISREPGSRSKIAVWSSQSDVDPVGACVGPRGSRVGAVVDELKGEKIDIIKYSEDPAEYIAAALAPATVTSVETVPEERCCHVVVPAEQLSLSIGKEGQNARLAAKLTGYKIDIKTSY
ncbi:MAG: transcription termination/antitermination protein NusA [Oscillospiraceae bacterium]|nr:transcription termination/antitermination protein NusA [Oscillospiraceae bacterium]